MLTRRRPSRSQRQLLALGSFFRPETTQSGFEWFAMRVLIVDDSALMRRWLKECFDDGEFVIETARSGVDALNKLDRFNPDVVTLDVNMPEMDGLEAARRITRKYTDDDRPAIIAMTANAMQGDREMCLEAGMDGYIAKPIRVERLIEALEGIQPRGKETP